MIPTNLPGHPQVSEELASRLQAALQAKGPGYVPRTHHLVDGGGPRFTNRLILETSPYLLQHAHNPVNWYPWGDEAFEAARRDGKPVFLSIGYSTCHWCHVMEGESFEDEEIAAFLNERFICIKVDREERPDVDAVYMSAVQNLTGSGGWPMSVWLDHERAPFFAGTYFPPRDGARGARHGFLTVLRELERTWKSDPQKVARAAGALVEAVRQDMEHAPDGGASGGDRSQGQAPPDARVIAASVESFKSAFDPVWGGVRRAPKFPSSLPVRLLLRYHRRTGDAEALEMATRTLVRMASGGMYDQLGGGFHRYSTDERWLVPHFEKMLYDNALLVLAYAEAHQATALPLFARVARETLDYVLREMTHQEGGFFSATDADSEGEEGRFFVWTAAEVRQALGADAARFMRHYGVTDAGNFEGRNILNVAQPDEAEHGALAAARKTLYDLRSRRPAPLRDDKILAAWNGLMISAFSVAGRILGEPRYVDAATRAARFVVERMKVGDRVGRSHKDGRTQPVGFLEDQAFVIAGLIDLYEASFDPRWLRDAIALARAMDAGFGDQQRGGWFMSPHDGERLLAREKPAHDGAEPSGTSVAILNALRLAAFTSEDGWRVTAERALGAFREPLTTRGVAMAEALLALDFHSDVPREIAIVWPGQTDARSAEPLLAVLRKTFVPNRVLAATAEGPAADALATWAPFVAGKTSQAGLATAYVCERGRCELPTTDPLVLARQLARSRPY